MRPVSFLLLFALASSFTPRTDGAVGPTAINSNPAPSTRALRIVHDTEEERAPNPLIAETSKVLGVAPDVGVAEASKVPSSLLAETAKGLEVAPDVLARLKKNLQKIPSAYEDLSDRGKLQVLVAHLKAEEVGFSKANVYVEGRGGLRAPKDYMVSHPPAATERIEGSAGVVYRMNEQDQPEFLLIGSSKNDMTFLLPKGKTESSETIAQSAMREIIEEAGNLVTLEKELDSVTKGKTTYVPFVAKSKLEYQDYAENARPRIWLSEDDAKAVLKDENMLKVFEQGLKQIKNGVPDEELRKLKLPKLRRADEEALAKD